MSATCLLQLGAAFRALCLELCGFGAYWDSPKTVAALGVSAFLYAGDILRCESTDRCELENESGLQASICRTLFLCGPTCPGRCLGCKALVLQRAVSVFSGRASSGFYFHLQ